MVQELGNLKFPPISPPQTHCSFLARRQRLAAITIRLHCHCLRKNLHTALKGKCIVFDCRVDPATTPPKIHNQWSAISRWQSAKKQFAIRETISVIFHKAISRGSRQFDSLPQSPIMVLITPPSS